MNEIITDEKWTAVEKQIYEAFKDVKLGNGIGYHEAECIDDYLTPADEIYQANKLLDEREDWSKLLPLFEDYDSDYISSCSFMDAAGLHFFLPIMLLQFWGSTGSLFSRVVDDIENEIYFWQKLTTKQRKAVIAVFEYHTNQTIDYFLNREERICEDCGKINCDGPLTFDETMEEMETDDEYQTLIKLRALCLEG